MTNQELLNSDPTMEVPTPTNEVGQEFEDEVTPTPPKHNPRGAGRKKGTRNKKVELQPVEDESAEIADVFDYCRNWVHKNAGKQIKMELFAGGDYIGVFRLDMGGTKSPNHYYLGSWDDVKRKWGGGVYSLKVSCVNNGRHVKSETRSIAYPFGTEETKDERTNENVDKANVDIHNHIPSMDALFRSSNGSEGAVDQNTIMMALIERALQPQKTYGLKEILKDLTAYAPVILPLVQPILEARKSQKQVDSEEMRRKLLREIREEEDRFNQKLKSAVEEKAELMGLQEPKGTVDQLLDVIKTVSPVLVERSKAISEGRFQKTPQQISQAVAAPTIKTPASDISPQHVQPLYQGAVDPVSVHEKPQVDTPKKSVKPEVVNEPSEQQKKIMEALANEMLSGKTPEQVAKSIYAKTTAKKKKNVFLNYKPDELVKTGKTMIQLDDEQWEQVESWVNKLYDNLDKKRKKSSPKTA